MPRPNWREESVSVAGIDVHFYRGGEGPPLVLLHGGDPNPGWLQPPQALAEELANNKFPIHVHSGIAR